MAMASPSVATAFSNSPNGMVHPSPHRTMSNHATTSAITAASPSGSIATSSGHADLPVRMACNFCRSKKIKCDKVPVEEGGCARCRREGIQCCYDVREPIGRPRKRRATEEAITPSHDSPSLSQRVPVASFLQRRPSKGVPMDMRDATRSTDERTTLSQRTHSIATTSAVMPSPSAAGTSYPSSAHMPAFGSPQTSWPGMGVIDATVQPHRWAVPSAPHAAMAGGGPRHFAPPTGFHPFSPASTNVSAPTSSLAMTPSSSTTMEPVHAEGSTTTTIDEAPTLSDLGLAAFLESLDTLEINPEDGLTTSMLEGLKAADAMSLGRGEETAQMGAMPSEQAQQQGHLQTYQNDTSLSRDARLAAYTFSLSSALSLANMQGTTSYAVPADLSWADSSWLDRIAATPANAATQVPTEPSPAASSSHTQSAGASPLDVDANLPMRTDWPRGPTSGMGQGELRLVDGKLLRPSPQDTTLSHGDRGIQTGESVTASLPAKTASCCGGTKKETKSKMETITDGKEHEVNDLVHPSPHPSNGSHNSSSSSNSATTRVHCVPDPTGRGCTCLCDVSVALINVRASLRRTREQHTSPEAGDDGAATGTRRAATTLQLTLSASQAVAAQCACSATCPTCRTDPSTSMSASLLVSTALQIYVRAVRTLRQGFGAHDGPSTMTTGSEWDVSIGQYKPKAHNAKRIALFAMKLELRDLRDAIAKVSRAACGGSVGAMVPSMDQQQQPAQQIAASSTKSAPPSCCSSTRTGQTKERETAVNGAIATPTLPSIDLGVNPIDQVVIRKLHQQLGDLLRTVEGIEEQQDAERTAALPVHDLF